MGGGGSRSRPQASPERIPHRTIDFPMPEKTHGRALRHRREIGSLLELLRRFVTERRVEPHAIVVAVDEPGDVFAEIIQIAVLVGVNFLSLESLDEALATRI